MDELNSRLIEMQVIEDEFAAIFKKHKLPIGGISQSGISISGQPIKTQIRQPKRNRELINTDFFDSTGKSALHFTSLKSLFSIINEKSIRMYDLNHSNDPNEYLFLVNGITNFFKTQGFSDEDISYRFKIAKENSYILSCTSPTEIVNKKFWREYADGGKGVGIEFTIINNPIEWDGFYFSKVKYGKMKQWDAFISDLQAVVAKHPSNRYELFFDMIFSLFKSFDYADEKEIRILAQKPEQLGFNFDSLIKQDISKNNSNLVTYLKLPIWVEKGYDRDFREEDRIQESLMGGKVENSYSFWSSFFQQTPSLKITKVNICQDSLFKDNDIDLFNQIGYNSQMILGYRIPVSRINYID
jgi:hypothetical protein